MTMPENPITGRETAAISPKGQEEPVAWLHEVKEPDRDWDYMLSKQPEHPWSHWVASHKGKCEFRSTPLYAHPVNRAGDVEGKPVAWRVSSEHGWRYFGHETEADAAAEHYSAIEPLYAHPAPSSSPVEGNGPAMCRACGGVYSEDCAQRKNAIDTRKPTPCTPVTLALWEREQAAPSSSPTGGNADDLVVPPEFDLTQDEYRRYLAADDAGRAPANSNAGLIDWLKDHSDPWLQKAGALLEAADREKSKLQAELTKLEKQIADEIRESVTPHDPNHGY